MLMKTLQSNLFIWSLATLISGGSLAACAQTTTGAMVQKAAAARTAVDTAKTILLQPLQQMVAKLKKYQATGDPDFDYAFQAKIQNQGIQKLLEQEIQSGNDSATKKMAQTLLTNAQTEVNTLNESLKQLSPSRPNQTFTQQQSRNVEAMNLKLQQTGDSDRLTSDVDKNFMTLLLDQRQDAIDMANTYLQYGKNDALRAYAQDMVAKAKDQMEQLKTMPK